MTTPDPELPPSAAAPVILTGEPEAALAPIVVAEPAITLGDVLRVFGVAFIAIVLFTAVAMGIAGHGNTSPAAMEKLARNPRVVLPPLMAAYALVVAYMVAIIRMKGRPFLETIQWKFPGTSAIGYAALGLALAFLMEIASSLLPIPKSLPIDQFFTNATGAYLMAFFGVTFAPFVEELFFRGFLFPALANRLGVGVSVGLTALGFAFIHAAQLAHAWAPLLLLWFVGLVLTAVRAWTKSVGASFCVHVGYNLTLFGLMYHFTDHFRHLEKLS